MRNFLFLTIALTNLMSSALCLSDFDRQSMPLQNIFKDRCNIAKNKPFCPYLPDSCCCAKEINTHVLPSNSSNHFTVIFCSSITEIPTNFSKDTTKIIFDRSRLAEVTSSMFKMQNLARVYVFEIFNDATLERIGNYTFSHLPELMNILIDNVQKLSFISETAFHNLSRLKTLKLRGTGLKMVHGFTGMGYPFKPELLKITISSNKYLKKIQTNAFMDVERAMQISVTANPCLEVIEDYAFNGSSVEILNFNDNEDLRTFSTNAFAGSKKLVYLYFNNTSVQSLPSAGLEKLQIIHAQNSPYLMRFPKLPDLHEALLTYPYHCCALENEYGFGTIYTNKEISEPTKYRCGTGEKIKKKKENKSFFTEKKGEIFHILKKDAKRDLSSINFSDPFDDYDEDNYSGTETLFPLPNSEFQEWFYYSSLPEDEVGKRYNICYKDEMGNLIPYVYQRRIRCLPEPDSFSPCENLLGNEFLTISSTFVALVALFGNFIVVAALLLIAVDQSRSQKRHLPVPRFLILNLAFADFCLGVFILLLVVMDRKTNGMYYKYGMEWQTRGGCDVVGFISVFASQLSIYTLSVISLERWYAIRYAIHLDKRMTLRCSQLVMITGWVSAIILASLPLAGINSYKKTAICLPMDVEKLSGQIYVGLLLSLNIIAFMIVLGSYVWMYALVRTANSQQSGIRKLFRLQQKRGSDDIKPGKRRSKGICYGRGGETKDARIAKKMAFLVFTDFACFFPISLFCLIAMAGYPILSLSTAKFLLIFCFPLNACANPFLYAVFTRSFFKDIRYLMKLVRRLCFNGDDRQRASSPLKSHKTFVFSSKQHRRTVQVNIDGDQEVFPAEETHENSTKMTSVNSRCNSVSARSSIKKGCCGKNLLKIRERRGRFTSSSTSGGFEDQNHKRPSVFMFTTFIRSKFRRSKNAAASNRRTDSTPQSFETHTTALASVKHEHEHEHDSIELEPMLRKMSANTSGEITSLMEMPITDSHNKSTGGL